jgi:hypothetical protein
MSLSQLHRKQRSSHTASDWGYLQKSSIEALQTLAIIWFDLLLLRSGAGNHFIRQESFKHTK